VRRASARVALLFLVIGCALWLIVIPAFTPRYVFTPRYYLILVALGDVLIVGTLYALIRTLRLPRLICATGLALYVLAGALWVVGTGLGLMLRDNSLGQAVGAVSTDAYLARLVRPYQAEAWINAHTAPDTAVALVGVTRGMYLDRPYLEDWYGDSLAHMEADPAERAVEIQRWCDRSVRIAVFDRGDDLIDDIGQAGIRPFSSFAWVRQPGLHPRVLFSAAGVDVVALNPCGTAR
jgi:hypothetical protein